MSLRMTVDRSPDVIDGSWPLYDPRDLLRSLRRNARQRALDKAAEEIPLYYLEQGSSPLVDIMGAVWLVNTTGCGKKALVAGEDPTRIFTCKAASSSAASRYVSYSSRSISVLPGRVHLASDMRQLANNANNWVCPEFLGRDKSRAVAQRCTR